MPLVGFIGKDFVNLPNNILGIPLKENYTYLFDQQTIELTTMLAATGMTGILLAFSMSGNTINLIKNYNLKNEIKYFKTLPITIWLFWTLFGFILFWMSSPQESIFQVQHTFAKPSYISNLNFNSAWLVASIVLTFSFTDSLLEQRKNNRAIKLLILLPLIFYSIVILDLSKGDRETLPWIFSLFLIYYYIKLTDINKKIKIFKIPFFKILIISSLILIINLIISKARQHLVGLNFFESFDLMLSIIKNDFSSLFQGTWTIILLSPVGIVGEYLEGYSDLLLGKDYLDIFLSIPPGFISDLFNYERPLNAFSSHIREMVYSHSGIHIIVLPFRNFEILGVFLILMIWAYFINRIEKKTMENISLEKLTLIGSILLVLPHWMWYGDKIFVNAMIIWFIFKFFYKISIKLKGF